MSLPLQEYCTVDHFHFSHHLNCYLKEHTQPSKLKNPANYQAFVFLQSMYIFLHTVKGTPFETPDQGKARLLTHWEQMDYGVQFTASRKFLTITPIVL